VQGFEDQQAEVLRLGLAQKSRALEDLGADAARLATAWKKEREEARRDLDAMRDLYKSTLTDVKSRDQRVSQLDAQLADKDVALEALAKEATRLSGNWKEQRGGLQKKIAALEKKLSACQKQLQQKAKQGDNGARSRLAEQLAVASDLQSKLALAKKREGTLKSSLMTLRDEVGKCKKEVLNFQSQKEKDAQALAVLRAELEEMKENYEVVERELAATTKALASSRSQRKNLQLKFDEVNAQLVQAQEQLKAARQQAEANKKAKVEAAEKAAQVKNLENQLGRLAVAQQELEGTLITTLGDFEQLQTSYVKLQQEAAGGGEVAQKAIAARETAEIELRKLQQKMQGEEAKLRKARERVQEVEEKHKAVEADAKAAEEAGKAALGKCEAELQQARREMGQLQLGKEQLVKETEALRKRFVQIEPVRYQLASANVVAQQQRVLAEVKQVLEVYPDANFSIKGHTCNIGSEEANLKLSEDRALVLRDFLVANGIEEKRFTLVEGCGDTEPQASNENDEGRQQNRRVEIEVIR
jgi:outer membrane protein OmpA-like peptidoglycan-associated protein